MVRLIGGGAHPPKLITGWRQVVDQYFAIVESSRNVASSKQRYAFADTLGDNIGVNLSAKKRHSSASLLGAGGYVSGIETQCGVQDQGCLPKECCEVMGGKSNGAAM
jgi:hypothetical protein